jgi:hypothetical protein
MEGTLDPHVYAQRRLRSIEREFVWSPGCDGTWARDLRKRLCDSIGLPERVSVPLDVETVETRDMGHYVRETITYATRPGLRMFAYLLTPKGVSESSPAVVCVPGHGAGVDAIVGEAPADYQNRFAVQCVEAGFVTLAIEPVGFGHRKAALDAEKGSSCNRDSHAATMLGETMIGWRCFDAMVSYDFLASRPEVDPTRIAIMGISGGGLVSFWTACLDERFAAAVVSGYFNTFSDSILSIEHCVDNFAPGLAKIVEMPDMAALIAPRKLFVESGAIDPIFPAEAFSRACAQAEAIYADQGAPGAFGCDQFDDDHIFSGQKALPKLREWFGA